MIGINNPMNVRDSLIRWVGMTGVTRGFCDFDTLEHGVRAAMVIIFKSYRLRYNLRTVSQIISRYASASEHDTADYIVYVSKHLGVSPDVDIYSLGSYYLCLLINFMAIKEGNLVCFDTILRVFDEYRMDFDL